MVSSSSAPTILCAGIAVQDIVFRVEQFPQPGGKCMTNEFIVVSGGCAVNAAIAVARLGGCAHYAGPLGDNNDNVSNQLMAEMAREGIYTSAVVRVTGATAPVSGIMVDAAGERMIVTHRDKRIETARLADPDRMVADISLLLADNRFPELVRPVCEAARRRGIPIVLDADRPTVEDDPLFRIPTHVIFSGECLRATTGLDDLSAGLQRMAPRTEAFLAVRIEARTFAAMAGVLFAPLLPLNPQQVTLFVISAFGAAALGGLRSLGWTFVGGLAIGVAA